ncbi:hypothetical protein JTE90_002901 [Oedothorax gibbosus]|uniref:Uncharacterized protein n=1 Tax=Oedothorax gibbosus TaxID=931172 RepID=A0AAV6UAN2_9ARAC|nr:hypothetical protein JTE90_002901 [Oedothorax gibbosus]
MNKSSFRRKEQRGWSVLRRWPPWATPLSPFLLPATDRQGTGPTRNALPHSSLDYAHPFLEFLIPLLSP